MPKEATLRADYCVYVSPWALYIIRVARPPTSQPDRQTEEQGWRSSSRLRLEHLNYYHYYSRRAATSSDDQWSPVVATRGANISCPAAGTGRGSVCLLCSPLSVSRSPSLFFATSYLRVVVKTAGLDERTDGRAGEPLEAEFVLC